MLSSMPSAQVERIEAARREGPFLSLDDFALRTGLSRAVLVRLAKAGAFGSLGLNRRESLWHALAQEKKALPLFDGRVRETHHNVGAAVELPVQPPVVASCDASVRFTHPALPPMLPAEEVLADYRTMGLSLRAHPLKFLRKDLDTLGVTPAERLKTCDDSRPVRVAGIVLVRQRPGRPRGSRSSPWKMKRARRT